MLVMSGQRTLSQNGAGELQLPDGKHVNSGAPISELLLWHEKCTLLPIFVFLVEATKPLRSTMAGQWTGWTMISTLCWWRVGVVQVNVPESSFWAWKILNRYSNVRSLPSSSVHPSGYFLFSQINKENSHLIDQHPIRNRVLTISFWLDKKRLGTLSTWFPSVRPSIINRCSVTTDSRLLDPFRQPEFLKKEQTIAKLSLWRMAESLVSIAFSSRRHSRTIDCVNSVRRTLENWSARLALLALIMARPSRE